MNDNDTLADDLRKDSLALLKLLADEKHKSEALAAVLRKIGYEPIGHAEATDSEILIEIVGIARSALETKS